MKFLAALLATAFAAAPTRSTTPVGSGTMCVPFTWATSGATTEAEWIAQAKVLSDAATAAGVFVTMDLAAAVDKGTYEVRFSAGDKVCELSTGDFTTAAALYTGNSVVDPWQAIASATGVSPVTCTGGGAAWTVATSWEVVTWKQAAAPRDSFLTCYTIAADSVVGALADVVTTTIIDTRTTATMPIVVDATKKRTVTLTRGLASSSLVLWLIIILLLAGGGGAAYYFMVIAPTM